MLEPLEPVLPDPLVEPLFRSRRWPTSRSCCASSWSWCSRCSPVPAEPLEPELLLSIVEPLDPEPLVPVEPVLPPLDWAKAAPAASIEITAKRFHHVFCMRKHSR